MRVTRLEIFGFKSFVERFVLSFDKDMIGIVGPNGCGKSNIVDALRWVLGETQAKQLRGNLFDDLIFNGTDARRPLGMAEVSLTIRPDVDLREAYDRLRSGLVVENGEVNPEEDDITRELMHAVDDVEVATQAVHEDEVNSAGTRLASSLGDIPGLFDAAEIQFTRRLYRSGESEYFINKIPCRLRDMIELYRLIGLGARGLSIVAQGQIGQFVSKKPLERRELLEEAAGIAGIRNRIETAQRRLERARENLARLVDIISEVEKQVRNLRRQAKRAQDRQELKDELTAADLRVFRAKYVRISKRGLDISAQLQSVREELSVQDAKLSELLAAQESRGGDIEELDSRLSLVRNERDELMRIAREHLAKKQQIEVALAAMDAQLQGLQGTLKRIDDRNQVIGLEVEKRRQNGLRLSALLAEEQQNVAAAENALRAVIASGAADSECTGETELTLRQDIEQVREKAATLAAISDAHAQAEGKRKKLKRELWEQREALSARKLALARVESEISTLESQLQERAKNQAEVLGNDDDVSVLLSYMTVAQPLEVAVRAALGERALFLVVDDIAEVARGFSVKRATEKTKKIGVIDGQIAATEWGLSDEERSVAPCARELSRELKVSEGKHDVISALLSEVILVDTLSDAIALYELYRGNRQYSRRTVVTKEGEVVTPWGWYSTSGTSVELSYTRRIEEGRQRIAEIDRECQEIEQGIGALEDETFRVDEDIRRIQSQRDEAIAAQQRLNMLVEQERKLERQREDARRERERAAQLQVRTAAQNLAQREAEHKAEERRVSELRTEMTQLETERSHALETERSLTREKNELASRLSECNAEFRPEDMRSKDGLTVEQLDHTIRELEQERSSLKVLQAEELHRQENFRRSLNALRQRETEFVVATERDKVELELLLGDIRERHSGLDPLNDEAALHLQSLSIEDLEAELDQAQQRLHALRSRLDREGEVDPQSIQLHEQESARLATLESQHSDLAAATHTLETTIRRLKEISRHRFVHTFDIVNNTFGQLIPRLFGGGAGHLELINPEDPLTSGIDLVVRIPGKKVRSMELLSGGEKAMVATAVLMAMFMHRPSPICVLDEVDAPLDDANLDRFLELVREISKTTQLLIITHNKQSMSAVDRLIGITMQEKGVSTALSVTFAEAEQQVEQWVANA